MYHSKLITVMPTWDEISNEIASQPSRYDRTRRKYISELVQKTGRNLVVYYSGWLQKEGYHLEIEDTDKIGFMTTIKGLDRSKGLDLMLHTPGGSLGATESIVDYLKAMFGNDIRAIVPQIAMSAGTMIACACKEIVMGKHSNLGPIDPQIGGFPTHGIIEEFNRAKKEIKEDPDTMLVWQTILSKYPPALIGECEKAIQWSETVVKSWLKENMFLDDPEKDEKIEVIIEELASHALTLSHDRHLSADILKNLGLKIILLEDDPDFQDKVLSVHHACIISLTQTTACKIVENHFGKAYIQTAE